MIDFPSVFSAIEMIASEGIGLLLYIFSGLAIGMLLGAMPGVSVTLAVVMMLIPSSYMSTVPAIVFLTSVYTGAIYGGGVSAILLNIPGTTGAVVTTFDGYQLTRMGRSSEALGYGIGASFVGCLIGYLVVLFAMFPVARLVLLFGPPELLMIALFALTIIGLIGNVMSESLIGGFLGFLFGSIGISAAGSQRLTFGMPALFDGIPLIPALVGMFALSEMLFLIDRERITDTVSKAQSSLLKTVQAFIHSFRFVGTLLRSGIIGVVVGMLPAAGATVATMISYGQARNFSKNRKNFGKGEPEGVIAAETANNASEGGSIATMLAFGIPGSGATAIIMVAFMMHGIVPGPYLVREHLDLAYLVILTNLIQGFVFIGVAFAFSYFASKLAFVKTNYLIPIIVVMIMIGTTQRGYIFDYTLLLFFGVLGYTMRKLGYPIIAMVMGIILAARIDAELIRTYRLYDGIWLGLLSRPIFLGLTLLTISSVAFSLYSNWKAGKSSDKAECESTS